MTIVLSLDIGTSKLCVMAMDSLTQQPVSVLSRPNDAGVGGLPLDWHEQDPRIILTACYDLLKTTLQQPGLRGQPIGGIGITGQMHGVLLVDGDLQPITNLITWRDNRTAPFIEGWRKALEPLAPQRTGCHIAPGYGGLTLAWLAQQGSLPAGAVALSIADFLAATLCGFVSSEPTHAASWGIYNLGSGGWDQPSIKALGIPPSLLPGVNPSCTPLGRLTRAAQQTLGLNEEIPVCSPLGDNQASVIGLTGLQSTALVLNLGTGGQVSRPRSAPVYQEGLETRPMPFGAYLQVGASLCGGWAYAYLEKFFREVVREFAGVELDESLVYTRMNIYSKEGQPGGLAVDTRFNGSRIDPTLRGAIQGIDTHNLNPAALTRATLEGIIQELYDLAHSAGIEGIEHIVATGNAVRRNPAVLEIILERFNLPCSVSAFTEEAALGAARSAMVGLKLEG